MTKNLKDALHRISLASQNSMSSKEECGRIAREALEALDDTQPTSALTTDDKKRLWLRLARRVQALVDLADLLAVDGHLVESTEVEQRLLDHSAMVWEVADDLAVLAQHLADDLAAEGRTP